MGEYFFLGAVMGCDCESWDAGQEGGEDADQEEGRGVDCEFFGGQFFHGSVVIT